MEKFEGLNVEVIKFEAQDIITTSGITTDREPAPVPPQTGTYN